MKKYISISVLFIISILSNAQVLSTARSVNWKLAGYQGTIPNYATIVNINNFGGDSTGTTSNNIAFANAVNSLSGANGVIYFPKGTYLFSSSINLPSGIILRGASSDSTTLKFNLGGGSSNDAIIVNGSASATKTNLSSNALKDSLSINVVSTTGFSVGDYIRLSFNDTSIITSSWAYGSVGQVAKIAAIVGNKITLENPLRLHYNIQKNSKITKLNMKTGIGIECLKVNRVDSSTAQKSNISFNFATQCWVKGIESDSCNFAHVRLDVSTNISVFDSYFHDAKAYGGGGEGYGVVCQFTTGECLIENNVFNHLRHSILLQAGSNGNVFGYNYSLNAFWTGTAFPANASGDMVLHGNYPYANLFEGNICQNIVIDDSHGKNGIFNTFFRNRAELFGIVMSSANAGDSTNFIGNEVTNSTSFYGIYSLAGNGNFEHGNNVKGTIYAIGTNTLTDQSYYYASQPQFLQNISNWPSIGISNPINSGTIPAKQRYVLNNFTICDAQLPLEITNTNTQPIFNISPNPSNGIIKIQLNPNNTITKFVVYSMLGNAIAEFYSNQNTEQIFDLSNYQNGIYFIRAYSSNYFSVPIKIVLQ